MDTAVCISTVIGAVAYYTTDRTSDSIPCRAVSSLTLLTLIVTEEDGLGTMAAVSVGVEGNVVTRRSAHGWDVATVAEGCTHMNGSSGRDVLESNHIPTTL
jgi:hypothetical protein